MMRTTPIMSEEDMQKLISLYRSDSGCTSGSPSKEKKAVGQQEHLNEYLENGWTVSRIATFGCGAGLATSIKSPDYPSDLLGTDTHVGGYLAVLIEEGRPDLKHKIVSFHRSNWDTAGERHNRGVSQVEHLNEYFEDGWEAIDMIALGAGSGQDATGGEIQGYLVVLMEKGILR
jgi:hypothetical protein